jgi:hypothetical protein
LSSIDFNTLSCQLKFCEKLLYEGTGGKGETIAGGRGTGIGVIIGADIDAIGAGVGGRTGAVCTLYVL